MLSFVSIAAVTDIRSRKIYNWTTYTGGLSALAIAGLVSLRGRNERGHDWLGQTEFSDAVAGLFACGGIMLVCYVFFKIGGGDVKLLAMLGAFLGLEEGIKALLWTLVLGGAMGLIVLVWKTGTFTLLKRFIQYAKAAVRMRGFAQLRSAGGASGIGSGNDKGTSLFLAPNALAAVIIVEYQLMERLGLA